MQPTPRSSWRFTVIIAATVLLPCLYGFGGKFLEFVHIFRGNADGMFAVTPIVNYLLASLGFFCLLGWATLRGMFRDIEAPKTTFLETEEWLDHRDTETAK